ncbi:MAG: O-acetyl-ADP-ribose deacetylase [Clostridia bacterium]|nr:O-acetyl-ADP-ribose deacetylase [Clostridia bacterium]MBR0120621.1 O-acetyl-ADP-ribose deacetylase [Clostridia bacterium]
MPLMLIRADITKMEVDAVVNAANSSLLGGGGVDGAIHRAAGPSLLAECRTLGGCETGQAKITGGYSLPCKYIIHTVGPVWNGGNDNEENLLYSCYSNSLALAEKNRCESVAFPLISSGIYGYPKAQALGVATRAVRDFLEKSDSDLLVYIVIFDKAAFEVSSSFFGRIEQKINDFEVERAEYEDRVYGRRRPGTMLNAPRGHLFNELSKAAKDKRPEKQKELKKADIAFDYTVSEAVLADDITTENLSFVLDESFSDMLLRKIDEKGMTDPECYKKANIDRRLFSKIRSDAKYKPSKQTALALAVALELPPDEINEMLMKAGYALSPSVLFDVIVKSCVEQGEYDVFKINEILFKYDQQILC